MKGLGKGKRKRGIVPGTALWGMVLAGMILAVNPSVLAAPVVISGGAADTRGEAAGPHLSGRVQPERFVLPAEARVLVVVEGTGGSSCQVSAYEREGDSGPWRLQMTTPGYLGHGGMSNHRRAGDMTTPIGVFQMNTPFGQADPLPGFPENYVKVTESYVWESGTNRLTEESEEDGERVGTETYEGHYDYVLDAGYNKNAIAGKGAALFLHCSVEGGTGSSGCVAIPKEQMAEVMCLYGTYGDGACYIAQAPKGTFHQIYSSYGTNQGLSPEGNF